MELCIHDVKDIKMTKYGTSASTGNTLIGLNIKSDEGDIKLSLFGLEKTRFKQLVNLMGGPAEDWKTFG